MSDTSPGTIYTNEFEFLGFSIGGIRYVGSTVDAPAVGWSDGGMFDFGGGNLDTSGSFGAVFQNNKFTFSPDPDNPDKQVPVSFVPANGAISGTFQPMPGAHSISFKGLVVPQGFDAGAGYGFFKGTNQTGYVYIHD